MKTPGRYKNSGMFKEQAFKDFNLPKEISDILRETANMALADKTKEKYNTALNNVKRAENELGEDLTFPWDNRKTLLFVGWLLKKDLSTSSIRGYLCGISKLHLALGYKALDTTPPILKEIFVANLTSMHKERSLA